jgi:UDP:flavonoid glycosyltransferase YjiC (YdhE family)
MRVLFAVLPGAGHLFPTIPLAWALRAAGHDVLVATAADEVKLAVSAGLPTVNTAPDLDVRAMFGQGLDTGSDLARMLRRHGEELARNDGRDPDFVLWMFAGLSDVMAKETVQVARNWKPDLVVYTRLQGAGLLAAAALGVPAVEHGFDVVRQDGFAARYLPFLAETAEQLGVPQRIPEIGVVHVTPPPLLVGEGADNWYMRYVPYNAGGVLPDWLWRPAERPRVVVTLGTVMPGVTGLESMIPVLAAAAEVDAEFLLAFGDRDISELGPLPPNARQIGWVPLYPLLERCAAVVQHGGATTTLTALAAGVPQLMLPQASTDFVHAGVVVKHGLGLRRDPDEVDPATLTHLIRDGKFQAAARATADLMHAQPTPVSQVPRIEAFVERAGVSAGGPVGVHP